MMRIQMLTCDRNPSYFGQSWRSMLYQDASVKYEDLRIVVHAENASFLDKYVLTERICKHTLTPEKAAEKKALRLPKQRVVHANRFMLECAADVGEFLFLEDDVMFAPNWFFRFQRYLDTIEDRDNCMVALHSHLPETRRGLVKWDPKTYWGLQGMWIGKNARELCLRYMQPNVKAVPTEAGDVRVKMMLLANRRITLYAIYPSLIQHTGYTTSIGSRFHLSPTFGQDVE